MEKNTKIQKKFYPVCTNMICRIFNFNLFPLLLSQDWRNIGLKVEKFDMLTIENATADFNEN